MNSIKIHKEVVGQMKANCYIIYNEESGDGIILDPGDDAQYLSQKILELKVNPQMILATHGHFDHVMAVTELKLAFDVPFYIRRDDLFLLNRADQTAEFFVGRDGWLPPQPDGFLKEGLQLKVGHSSFEVVSTPGHTPGSVSFYFPEEEFLFVGDVLFSGGGMGRTDFPYSSFSDLKESIEYLLTFPSDTMVFSGHGPETTVYDEQINFDFLEEDFAEV